MRLTQKEAETFLHFSDLALPRHTSYPIVPKWNQKGVPGLTKKEDEIGLYIHIPYCHKLCYYCGCSKTIVDLKKNDPRPVFLKALFAELYAAKNRLKEKKIVSIHFGGGTPTFLSPDDIIKLGSFLKEHFSIEKSCEIAMELDPRSTNAMHLDALKEIGVNRTSIGVQDFDAKVQKAVNRIQPYEMVAKFVKDIRERNLGTISFDLIYGLPYQTVTSMQKTLKKVHTLGPDRVAFYRLAMIPELFRWQKSFTKKDLPSGLFSANLMLEAMRSFGESGYEYIGLDHFAKKDDALSKAKKSGDVCRNFQGTTTKRHLPIIGFGPTAISNNQKGYAQNTKDTRKWLQAAMAGKNLIEKSHLFGADDIMRKNLLQDLYGSSTMDLEKARGGDWQDYFKRELSALKSLKDQGVIEINGPKITLTEPLGRLLARSVASVMDAYLPKDAWQKGLSMLSKVG